MKLHGWCEKCRKVKRVNVKTPRPGSVQTGTCDACAEKQRTERKGQK